MRARARKILQGEQGLSMILVLCLGALFVALAAALVFAASVLTANANRQLQEQEAYQLATSFSDVLDQQLLACDGSDTDEGLGRFLNREYLMQIYGNNPQTHEFTRGDDLKITLSKTPAEDVDGSEYLLTVQASTQTTAADLKNLLDSYTGLGSDAASKQFLDDYLIDVTVTATAGDQSFSYTRSYQHAGYYNSYYITLGSSTAQYTAYTATDDKTVTFSRSDVAATAQVTAGQDTEIKIHFDLSRPAAQCSFERQ